VARYWPANRSDSAIDTKRQGIAVNRTHNGETQIMDFKTGIAALCGILALTVGASDVRAAAFALQENSGVTGGTAYAGASAAADDLATIYNNPAAMVFLKGVQAEAAGNIIMPSSQVTIDRAATAFGQPNTGGNPRDIGQTRLIPALYSLVSATDNLKFGLAVTVPFALITSYDAGWAGRYQALYSEIRSLNINPNFGYRVNDWFSLGGGFAVQKIKAKLTNAVDFGVVEPSVLAAAGLIPAGLATPLAAAQAQKFDGRADLQGTGWGTGFNLGTLFEPWEGGRIALTYRSKIVHKVDGRANFAVPTQFQALFQAANIFQNTGAHADLDTPAISTLGLYQEFGSRWTALAQVQVTQWSTFKQFRVDFDNANQPASVTPENYQDSVFASIGGVYKAYRQLWFRAGVAYDQTPVTDQFRNFRVPDADRYWISTGINYRVTDNFSVDGTYSHLFFSKATVTQTTAVTADTVSAHLESHADIVGVSARLTF
jgi:long-chain fatty acid transport protein